MNRTVFMILNEKQKSRLMLHGIMQKCYNKREQADEKNENNQLKYYFIENDFICRFAKRINWMRDKQNRTK